MVDKERRKKLAYHMRQLSVGVISNDEFESDILEDVTNGCLPEFYCTFDNAKTDDAVIVPILERCWALYDDLRNHKLKGRDQLSSECLKAIARCILFLHSDLEYEWPYLDTRNNIYSFSLKDYIVCLLTLGQNLRIKSRKRLIAWEAFKKAGALDYWPFYRQSDYDRQLTKQPFLSKTVFC